MNEKQTRAYMRQAAFIDAFLTDKPLKPEGGQWTNGDLVWLAVTIKNLIDRIPAGYRTDSAFDMPLSEILD